MAHAGRNMKATNGPCKKNGITSNAYIGVHDTDSQQNNGRSATMRFQASKFWTYRNTSFQRNVVYEQIDFPIISVKGTKMSKEFSCPDCNGHLSRLYTKPPPNFTLRSLYEWRCNDCGSAFILQRITDPLVIRQNREIRTIHAK